MPHTDPAVALTIAGSDSGGGAGIQADLKTMEALGVFGTSAITSVTAQNTHGVTGIEDVSPEMVARQIEAVTTDFAVGAAKTGMLSNADIIRRVADALVPCSFPLVIDPVMIAQSGDRLLRESAISALREDLIPHATLVTPNLPEAELLTDTSITDQASMETAAHALTEQGPTAALVTGGHLDTEGLVDVLYRDEPRVYRKDRIDTQSTHGSGCMISAAITAELARGAAVPAAVDRAEALLDRAIRYGLPVGQGYGSVHHLAALRNDAARFETLTATRQVVSRFEQADISRLIPEVGLNIAVATPYALSSDEVAAIDGRMTRTTDGVAANAGVWFGASSHMARFLLAVRRYDQTVTVACNLRVDPVIEREATALWDVAELTRAHEPPDVKTREGGTMAWSVEHVMNRRDSAHAPDAVLDRGEVGKEPMLRVLAPSPEEAQARVLDLHDRLDDSA